MDNFDTCVEEFLKDVFVNPPVSPTKANFKGEFSVGAKTQVRLRQGMSTVQNLYGSILKNELLWVTPEGRILYLCGVTPEGNYMS